MDRTFTAEASATQIFISHVSAISHRSEIILIECKLSFLSIKHHEHRENALVSNVEHRGTDRPQRPLNKDHVTRLSLKRARSGRVKPLGRPKWVFKNGVECRFLSRNGQMTLKVKVNGPHFQQQL